MGSSSGGQEFRFGQVLVQALCLFTCFVACCPHTWRIPGRPTVAGFPAHPGGPLTRLLPLPERPGGASPAPRVKPPESRKSEKSSFAFFIFIFGGGFAFRKGVLWGCG